MNSAGELATRILLVEDMSSDAELVRLCLEEDESAPFRLIHAQDMTTARQLLAEQQLHAVMLDLFLPDTCELDGLASIQALAPQIPVLILTGREDEDLAFEAIENGAQDYILKEKINPRMLRRSLLYAIQRKRFEDGITQQAHFDKLTGLPNRDMLMKRLDIAFARQKRMSCALGLMMLDLNGFKAVNDMLGHAAGDLLLQEISRRIPHCLRPYDMAARFGGDEFVVFIEDSGQTPDYAAIARKLIQQISLPIMIRERMVGVGVSIGISVCSGAEGMAPETMLSQADEAMYWAKLDRKGSYRFYSPARRKLVIN